ncbi:MAG: hypothetical protein D6820_05575, partial [Lentisphaerae bacterium]
MLGKTMIALGLVFCSYARQGVPDKGIGLDGIAYWSTQMPFVDVIKRGQGWVSFKPGGGWKDNRTIPLDANGWPTSLASDQQCRMLCITHSHHHPTGDYVLTWQGDGVVSMNGGTLKTEGVRRRVYSVTDPNSDIWVVIESTNPTNHVRNIRLWLPGFENADSPFYPTFKDRLKPFNPLRFMDWAHTNNSGQREWSDRRPMNYAWQGGEYNGKVTGVAWEYMIDLCNELQKDMWICVPHMASDDYCWKLAHLILTRLDARLKVYVEYSNEVWNGQFGQFQWLDA